MYYYATEAPVSSVNGNMVVGMVFLLVCFSLSLVSVFVTMRSDDNWFTKFSCVLLSLSLGSTLLLVHTKEESFRKPAPEFTTVTATRTGDGDFSRQERTGKHSSELAGYLAYRINDGSNLTYFVRIRNGTFISDNILLYKWKKE